MIPSPTAVIVLAAGLGTRMRSEADTAKVLHEVGGRSMLRRLLHSADALAPEHLVVVVGHALYDVTCEVAVVSAELGRPITVVEQIEQRGSGDALRTAVTAPSVPAAGTFLVLSGDVPLLQPDTMWRLLARHHDRVDAATVLTTEMDDPTGYGRIVRDGAGAITAIVEDRVATPEQRSIREVNGGVYAFDASFLGKVLPDLGPHDPSGEVYLTDVIEIAHREGRIVHGERCPDSWQVLGVNTPEQLAELRREYQRRLNDAESQ